MKLKPHTQYTIFFYGNFGIFHMIIMMILWLIKLFYNCYFQAATFEVLLVRNACLFDVENGTMMFTCGKLFQRPPSDVSLLIIGLVYGV
jgi:hypothetical protein